MYYYYYFQVLFKPPIYRTLLHISLGTQIIGAAIFRDQGSFLSPKLWSHSTEALVVIIIKQ